MLNQINKFIYNGDRRLVYLALACILVIVGLLVLDLKQFVISSFIFLTFVIACERARFVWNSKVQEYQRFWSILGEMRGTIGTLDHRMAWLTRLQYESSLDPNQTSNSRDITVIYGVKNRYDYRIINSLKSIRSQDYNQELLKILIVDYDSDSTYIPEIKNICERFNASYFRIENRENWNRAECLNQGINHSQSRYVLFSDVDIIFQSNYISTAIKELTRDRYQVIYSKMLDLPEGAVVEEVDVTESYLGLKSLAEYGGSRGNKWYNYFGLSLCITERTFLQRIHGFDENFILWGCEDDDLARRLEWSGVRRSRISEDTSLLHQWHPRYEGVSSNPELAQIIKQNREYLQKSKLILAAKSSVV